MGRVCWRKREFLVCFSVVVKHHDKNILGGKDLLHLSGYAELLRRVRQELKAES